MCVWAGGGGGGNRIEVEGRTRTVPNLELSWNKYFVALRNVVD